MSSGAAVGSATQIISGPTSEIASAYSIQASRELSMAV